MATVKKILCPLELWEEKTTKILDYAAMMAKTFGAELILVHVTPTFDEYTRASVVLASATTLEEEILEESEAKMKKLLNSSKLKDIKATNMLVKGSAAEAILEAAKKQKAEMIVMGTHARGAVGRVLFGSVAEKVVRTSPIPVVTVRP